MAIRTELTLRLPNSPGALADVCRLLAADRVRVLALALESAGTLRLLVDNPLRAVGLLRARRHTVTEKDVIAASIPSGPGGLAHLLGLLADAGVNVDYAYAGAADGSTAALAVVGVDDAVRAAAAAGA